MSWFSLGSKSATEKTTATVSIPGMGPSALLGAMSTAVIALDAQFTVRALNAAAEALVSKHPAYFGGLDATTLPGSRVDVLGPDVMATLHAPQNLPMTTEWSSGETTCILTLNALRLDGAITGYTLEYVDISGIAKKAREDAEELKVRSQIMDMTSIVSFADLKGDIITINEKFMEVSQYGRDELIGHGHNTTRHPDMPKDVFKEMWSTIGRGKVFRGVVKNRKKDGTPYYVDAVIAPFLGANGRPRKYLGVRYDITDLEIERQNMRGLMAAIDESYAFIEFDLSGKVVNANKNFLAALGYRLEEIQGRHHAMFCEPAYANSQEYTQFWADLNAGIAKNEVFKRKTKAGADLWIQAVYAPVRDEMGRVMKVVKIATDITEQKNIAADHEGQMNAIRRALCVIEYTIDGKVLKANENFCTLFGYREEELLGQAHSILMAPGEQETPEYRAYREKLRAGQHDTGIYKRVAKDGRVIWIQGSCNPIFDPNGNPYKIVTMFTDISAQVLATQMTQRAVEEVAQVVAATKDNDLTLRIPLGGKTGEIEQLCSGVNGLIDTMSGVIATISEAAGTITTAVSEITSGTDDLSRRTEKQASSLEETSASMEEIASTIRLNAENAQEANKLAVNARTLAGSGGDIVTHAVEAMSRIEESSTKVSDIIGVIDEIAFQTNLLALNAAVEAARAGDAGRGFAVVASEVRSLAQRSSEAAKDIKALIVQSGAQVKDGVKLVNDAGSSLSEIVSSVRRVTDIIAEIASASKEQAVGVEEINKAVSQMDEMTQQNSALVEENAAACRLLQDQAEEMAGRMAAFRLDTEIVTLSARPAARRPQPAPARSVPQRRGGGAAALQADLAHAFADEEWKEF